eukprot:6202776-Pleurochrysis_carterae.AAC.6
MHPPPPATATGWEARDNRRVELPPDAFCTLIRGVRSVNHSRDQYLARRDVGGNVITSNLSGGHRLLTPTQWGPTCGQ